MVKDLIRRKIKTAVLGNFQSKYKNEDDLPAIDVREAPEKYGDYTTNIAFSLAKKTGDSPEEVASKIISQIPKLNIFEDVTVTSPGFINFKLAIPFLLEKFSGILTQKDYDQNFEGRGRKVDVEFISANPTGPLTIGNARGGVIGDCVSNVLEKSGYDVCREYYFNDAGGQIDVLGHSVLKDDQAQYKGEYIDDLAKKIKTDDYRKAGREAAKIIIGWIKNTTLKMGIKFDVWFAEGRDLREKNKVNEVLQLLRKKGLSYEKEGAIWFRSTKFKDDKDRVLVRSNGEPTYFAVDCAYHRNKFEERKFDWVIDIWGADHHGDTARVRGFVEALGYEQRFKIILHQFVRVVQNGREVRMSKRMGNFITVEDLIDEVGLDAYRFFMLSYDINSHLNFDLNLAKERSQKNPVYYVQYAAARCSSILKKADGKFNEDKSDLNLLKDPSEIALIKKLIELPDLVLEISHDFQIQKLPQFAKELAGLFHLFYEKCPVITEDEKLSATRILLVKATLIGFQKILQLMGISVPDKM